MRIRASAPGKLVLLGEYAVLNGAPAVVLAVDRRARVEIVPSGRTHSLLEAPAVAPESIAFHCDDAGEVLWQDLPRRDAERLGLVAHVLRELRDRNLFLYTTVTPFRLALDTSRFFQHSKGAGHKLGFGSSAALTVALCSALTAYAGRTARPRNHATWLPILLSIHRRFQEGRGSGLDVAASLTGGVISYRLDAAAKAPELKALSLPANLHLLCVWSGTSVSTGESLIRFADWQRQQPESARQHLASLRRIAETGLRALNCGDTALLLRTVADYGQGLRTMGEACGIEFYTPAHRRIEAMATTLNVAYKPSGAGGGDTGIALGREPDKMRSLAGRLEQAGIRTLPLQIDPQGLTLTIDGRAVED